MLEISKSIKLLVKMKNVSYFTEKTMRIFFVNPIETETRLIATRGWLWRKWGDVGQRVQFPGKRWLNSGYLTYSIVIIDNNTALYT